MVNPTTAMPDAPMSGLANLMAMKGRDNDSMLVHLSPNEVNNLNKLSGNTMTINPATGLPEGRSRFLEAALPALLSIGAGIATGGMSIPAQMAAAAAAGYGGQRLVGKGHDEALTSAVIGGAKAAQEKAAQTLVSQGSDQTAKMIADQAIAAGNQGLQGSFSEVVSNLAPSGRDLYATIKASGLESLKNPSIYLPLAGRAATGTAGNALVDQMRADATRPRPIPMGMETEEIDIYSTPFTQTTMGPFNQQQIASNFISGGTAPYGFNYFNQAYGQEGGQVEEMNQGGLTQFQSIMGNPALQIQNPNPPLKMAEGGVATPQMGPRGSSQGGKGSGAFSEMLNNPEVLAMLGGSMSQTPKSYDVLASIGANPPQQMNHGGMTGAGTANSSIIPAIAPLIEVANQQAQERLAKGGEIVEGLKEIATKKQPSMPAFEGRVKGQGDGMSDDIPFNIEGQQPALLARDEYVIPADVVAMVGNGSSDAGADKIDGAIANIRQEKYGRAQQPRETEGLGGLLG